MRVADPRGQPLASEAVTNAVVHADSESTIVIHLDGNVLRVTITDRGRGRGRIDARDGSPTNLTGGRGCSSSTR